MVQEFFCQINGVFELHRKTFFKLLYSALQRTMSKQILTVHAPRHSWIDSFASADGCPFSPRYRTLAVKREFPSVVSTPPKMQKSCSQPNLHCNKENEEDAFRVTPFSKKQRSRSGTFNRAQREGHIFNPETVLSPRYGSMAVDRKTSLQAALSLNSILSPRYDLNVRHSNFPMSPRYGTLINAEVEDFKQCDSESDFSENLNGKFSVFSPRYGGETLMTPSAEFIPDNEPVAKDVRTVLALLQNLDDSCSEFDEDHSVVE